jgi:hypothetical protein
MLRIGRHAILCARCKSKYWLRRFQSADARQSEDMIERAVFHHEDKDVSDVIHDRSSKKMRPGE